MKSRGIVVIFLTTSSLSVQGFVPSRQQHRPLDTTRCSAENIPRKQQKKPRRFSQAAHSVPKRLRKKPRSSFNQEEHEHRGDSERSSSGSSQHSGSSSARDAKFRSSGKSIEELEAIMSGCWGTQLKQRTADPEEYEFVYDDDDDDDKRNKQKSNTFRGKPVLDPWQKEARKNGLEDDSESTVGFFDTQDDAMLNRVRKNQERLKKKQGPSENQHNERRRDSNVQNEPDLDFSDQHDEEYENDWRSAFSDDDVDFMENIDRNADFDSRDSKMTQKSEEVSPSGGFFFNAEAAKAQPKESPPPQAETKPKRRKKKRARIVYGNDGHPIYLTTEQAQKDFQSSLDNANDVVDGTEYSPPATRSWEELGITSPQLLNNLEYMECGSPLSVQDKVCEPALMGKDVLVGTYTGSGKTLAFLVPIVERLLNTDVGKDVKVLIVAPGRELASQIVSVARSLLEYTDISVMMAIGGTTFGRNLEQIRKRKPTILVGTPGRVAELVVGKPGEKSGRLKISSLQMLVLDEFDALMEYKPHRDPTDAILHTLKRRHGDSLQSILCSATASDMIKSTKLQSFLRPGYAEAMADKDDQLITSGSDTSGNTRVSRTVMHGVVNVPHRRLSLETLRRILHTEPIPQQVLIFADNSRRVEIVIDKLADMGIVAAPLHGGRGSEKADRAEVSRALREGYVGIVVATELAARGLDAPLLTHVINLDLPTDASHYAHRAGRCGRGGRPGVVINFTTSPQERKVPYRFAEKLGVKMQNVEPRNGKLVVVEESNEDEVDADFV